MFVLDEMQRLVYRYDLEGNFHGVIGGQGAGPGEYADPGDIQAIWGNQIAVMDRRGKLIVYDVEGNHQFTLKQNKGAVISRGIFHWPRQDRMFAVNPFSKNLAEGLVQVVDYTILQKPAILGAFSTDYRMHEKFGFGYNLQALALVDNTLWTANPYEGHIEIFDLDGKMTKRVSLRRPDPMNIDFAIKHARKHGDSRKYYNALKEKEAVFGITPIGSVVLVQTTKGQQLFDRLGEPVSRLLYPTLPAPLGSFEDMAVFSQPTLTRDEANGLYDSGMKPEYEMMKALGFNMDEETHDIYFCFRKVLD